MFEANKTKCFRPRLTDEVSSERPETERKMKIESFSLDWTNEHSLAFLELLTEPKRQQLHRVFSECIHLKVGNINMFTGIFVHF